MKRGPPAPPAGAWEPFSSKVKSLTVFGFRSGPDGSGQAIRFIWSLFRAKRLILDPIRALFGDLGPNRHGGPDLDIQDQARDSPLEWVRPVPKAPEQSWHASGPSFKPSRRFSAHFGPNWCLAPSMCQSHRELMLRQDKCLLLKQNKCLSSSHLSCLNRRHLSCLNSWHLSCLNRRHNSSRPEAGSCRVLSLIHI